jgi:hypothetical protein
MDRRVQVEGGMLFHLVCPILKEVARFLPDFQIKKQNCKVNAAGEHKSLRVENTPLRLLRLTELPAI